MENKKMMSKYDHLSGMSASMKKKGKRKKKRKFEDVLSKAAC